MARHKIHGMWFGVLILFGIISIAPVNAQEHPEREALILSPAAGAAVTSPVTVTFGLQAAGSSDNGSGQNGGHHWTPHAFLAVDVPTPAAGTPIQSGAQYIPFPSGQTQISVALSPGQHQLQIVMVNRAGNVSKHMFAAAPIEITVQP
jgi:hypothetical protein